MRKVYDVSKLDEKQQGKLDKLYDRLASKGSTNEVPSYSGVMGTEIFGPDQEFKVSRNEMVLRNHGSYIVFGADRPSSKASGEGGIGAMGANSIDLVVGRMASARGGKGARSGAHVDSSYSADAARVLISQLTKVDKHFGITHGMKHPAIAEQPRSAVAIKADNVRLIGRENIKIVTGKQMGVGGFIAGGEPNSLGSKMHQPAPTIELIAGNSSSERYVFGGFSPGPPITKISHLQPAVMGDNIKSCLRELMHIVEIIWDAVTTVTMLQMFTNLYLSVEPFNFIWDIMYNPSVMYQFNDNLGSMMAMWSCRIQMMFWELNYLYPFGFKHIVSANVKLT